MNAPLFTAITAVTLYSAATFWLLKHYKQKASATTKLTQIAGILALICHIFTLSGQISLPTGIDLSVFIILSLISAVISALTIGFSFYQPTIMLTLGAFPFAAFSIMLSLIPHPISLINPTNSAITAHILLSILAYSLLLIAACQAVLLAMQNRHLRHYQTGLINALPPLITMERILFDLIFLGFLFLSLAMVTGLFVLENIFAQHVAHKTLFTLIAWITFLILLYGRWYLGWRGQKAIRFTLIGVSLLVIGFFGSKIVLELILHMPHK